MNLIESLAAHLEYLGLGALATDEREGDLFWGYLPDAPDAAVCVMSTDSAYPGSPSGARVQVFTRGAVGDGRGPYERACRITEELEAFSGYLCGDGLHVRVEAINSAQGTGLDSRGRHLYVSNYRVYYCEE